MTGEARRFARLRRRLGGSDPMLYPDEYAWLVLVSGMDVMLTFRILERGGTEVNPIASLIIGHWGLPGALAFKFSLMLFVIIVCEVVGRTKHFRQGLVLARVSIAVSSIPILWSIFLLYVHTYGLDPVAAR